MTKMTMSGLDGSGGGGGGGASRDVSVPQVTPDDCVYMHLRFMSAYDNEFSRLRRLWKSYKVEKQQVFIGRRLVSSTPS